MKTVIRQNPPSIHAVTNLQSADPNADPMLLISGDLEEEGSVLLRGGVCISKKGILSSNGHHRNQELWTVAADIEAKARENPRRPLDTHTNREDGGKLLLLVIPQINHDTNDASIRSLHQICP